MKPQPQQEHDALLLLLLNETWKREEGQNCVNSSSGESGCWVTRRIDLGSFDLAQQIKFRQRGTLFTQTLTENTRSLCVYMVQNHISVGLYGENLDFSLLLKHSDCRTSTGRTWAAAAPLDGTATIVYYATCLVSKCI